ncbi:heparinase II/III domain-containing protein [Planctobacterium marinum]
MNKSLRAWVLLCLAGCVYTVNVQAQHPNLVITSEDVRAMREAVTQSGGFAEAFQELVSQVEGLMSQPIQVPTPQDGGGGYSHERHKKNYQLMYNAAVLYQLTENTAYAKFVADMLLQYAAMYPDLPLHPKRKMNFQNPGKLYWQSLNEAMWLVYTIQAYDMIAASLEPADKASIIQKLLRPMALFLSEGQPSTFDKVHNHGTWATAAVGMTGYVLGEAEWVEKALYGLDKSGKSGFLKQLDELFSPQGYYNEGPYYQRFALLPFITFAQAINNNQPHRDIFKHRDEVLLKAIDTTIQLSYNGLFFPINDAIKSKGIETIELVHGVTLAYSLTGDTGYLDIAQKQGQIVLTGAGLKVAQALEANSATHYQFKSVAFGDGADGKQGALVVMRNADANHPGANNGSAVLFKPAAQGLGHGHFDKLTWQFYHKGAEIVSDYGAARFLNVEAKYGGRYLPENTSYAKQTVAHNTLVVDETSHFNGELAKANRHHPTLELFATNHSGSVVSAQIDSAYAGVNLERTMALLEITGQANPLVLDIFNVSSDSPRQLDLPVHYLGQLISSNFKRHANTTQLSPLGNANGYQHLWLKAQGKPYKGLAKVTLLNDNGSFYTLSTLTKGDEQFLFTQIGANDPDFNLRNEQAVIRRVEGAKQHTFVSVFEPHGDYNPSKEYTLNASSQLSAIEYETRGDLLLVQLVLNGTSYLIAIDKLKRAEGVETAFKFKNQSYSLSGPLAVYLMTNDLE